MEDEEIGEVETRLAADGIYLFTMFFAVILGILMTVLLLWLPLLYVFECLHWLLL